MRSPIYTLEEIEHLPRFGAGNGWFYGLVKDHETGRIGLYEIFPGLGYASVGFIINPRNLWWIVSDIWKATRRKEI